MPHEPEHKGIVDAVIDHELDVAEMAKSAYESGRSLAERLKNAARQMVQLRRKGKITEKVAEGLWVKLFRNLVLMEFSQRVGKIQETADRSVQRKIDEAKKLGPSIRRVGAVRNADIKNRELERRGALDAKGKIDGAS